MELELEQPQSKRKRRPSVRLGEIGEIGFASSSSLWLEPPRQRGKQQTTTTTSNGAIVKQLQPRIRPLEHVARGEKVPATAIVEEEWSVVAVVEGAPLKEQQQQGKRRSGGFEGKVPLGGLRWSGSKVRGWQDDAAARSEPPVEEGEKDRHEAPFLAETSSDSEGLIGRGLKEHPADDSGDGASEGSEGGDACANPNSHGDEMQGAIEDGPGQANGKGFRTVKGVRRSGRQVARRIASRDTARVARMNDNIAISREKSASRDTAGEEPSFAGAAPGTTTIVTPSSSQRLVTLSAGVSGWLQELGLGKYSELFELNEVDTEVLPFLTMDDLREMGVDAVGARRKMFSNIQELGQL